MNDDSVSGDTTTNNSLVDQASNMNEDSVSGDTTTNNSLVDQDFEDRSDRNCLYTVSSNTKPSIHLKRKRDKEPSGQRKNKVKRLKILPKLYRQ
jgi:hypothetical protein